MHRQRSFSSTMFSCVIGVLCLAFPSSAAGISEGSEIEVVESIPVLTSADWQASQSNRIMVLLNTDITESILGELGEYGKVHGWVEGFRLVAMTLPEKKWTEIEQLPFVEYIDMDRPLFLTDLGTWDRDIIDVTDVEESFTPGDPDPREIAQTGSGVHVFVIDSGLPRNWRDFLPEERVNTSLARAVAGGGAAGERFPLNELNTSDPKGLWDSDNIGHGMAVASHIIGFKFGSYIIDGVAPGASLVPIKTFTGSRGFTSRLIAAVDYVVGLKNDGIISSAVINMSVGDIAPSPLEKMAINRAIEAGIILVAAAGNEGEAGMIWPGAYPEMISAGAVSWTKQWQPNITFWWQHDVSFDPDPGLAPFEDSEVYVTAFSSRAIPDLIQGFPQQLDLLAPGDWTLGPWGAGPHARYAFLEGTSFASPLTAGVAALLLEKNPLLTQLEVEQILKSTAVPVAANDSRSGVLFAPPEITWDTNCRGHLCDPVGAGLLQADNALAAIP